MGITDVDDKILHKAVEKDLQGWPKIQEMVRGLEADFFRDLDRLNVRRPDVVLRVSEHMDEIVSFIQRLETLGFAYRGNDGIYFDVSKLGASYGKLGGVDYDASSATSETIERIEEAGKRDVRDFSLWKLSKSWEPVFWSSPWGNGRPGWHIECSAMTNSYFGPNLDFHSGGIDLKFPHHTNEIAQR